MPSRTKIMFNRLQSIGNSVQKTVEDELLMEIAEDVAQVAARNSRERTGHLRDSWQAELDKPGEAWAYSDDFKAHFHEFGTVYMSAQPMATPASEEARATLDRTAKAAIRKAVK